ncbi:MAG: PQQ-binding-like beta-propeller repeat protein [Natronomonas sp.]|jgi:outer membrane protein assembly factor BamB|uniref:outer membrane protein assembly factor BamB family protein n=1 Tax=Natronomonas sp. TaxID=2184060 RepID=UPI0028700127|nr:PQQ-binding-like beta-propeller repeat protein [Natronomonas sp.]MDR9429332.1 PQQ-binding-like beta-propeller repeat protein [Natronomonas sp.]
MSDRSDGGSGLTRRGALASLGALAVGSGAGWAHLRSDYDRTQADFDPALLPYDETYPDDDGITMFRQGLRRLGYYPDAVVAERVEIEWSMPVNGIGHTAAKSSPRPTPDGETVLIPSDTGMLHAVRPDGERLWSVETGASRGLGFHGTPLVVDDTAYIGGYDGSVYAYDVETGRRVWKTSNWRLDAAVAIGSSPAYWDGIIYVVAEYNFPWEPPSGKMWALDAATGQPLWKDGRLWGMPHPSTSVDPATERMLTGSNDGVCYAWEFPSLDPAWEFQTDGEIKGTIPTYEGHAFVGSWDGHFYCLDLRDGTEKWSFETGRVIMSNPGIDPDAGVVYMGSDDNRVYALDTETGEELWSTNVGGTVLGSLTVTSGTILVGSYDTHLYALDKTTGEVRWRVEGIGHVTSEAVPHGDRIFFAERGDISGYWDSDEPETLHERGRAYSLVRR